MKAFLHVLRECKGVPGTLCAQNPVFETVEREGLSTCTKGMYRCTLYMQPPVFEIVH